MRRDGRRLCQGAGWRTTFTDRTVHREDNSHPAFTASSKAYDGGVTANVAFTGFTPAPAGGDSVSVSWTSATFATSNVGTSKTVTISGLALTGAQAFKYALRPPLRRPRPTSRPRRSPSAASPPTTRSTTATRPRLSTSGALPWRRGHLTWSPSAPRPVGTFADKNVGTGKTVTVSGLTLGGADCRQLHADASRRPRPTSRPRRYGQRITAGNKVYDGNTTATLDTGALRWSAWSVGDASP